ncbi:Hypothetical predicted protein [Mytilus galloprovincialis]|uniref:Uncharacterized protein n=1 Tax=Mytilus galloprovincialis TaxID=29158 RepID=A0A8B6GA07_MYTGA|nr:Hypothetical predicted protein [Mytilus galloprovincialis]
MLVDVEEDKIIKTINLFHQCEGVASDGKLLVINSRKTRTIVNLNDMSQTELKGGGETHISLFQGNIYSTIYYENKICCYKETGEPLWIFQHKDIDCPEELTLDKNGFVYISSLHNNSIVVLSPDSKTCKTILSEAYGIKSPVHIDIHRETGVMIVSSETKVEKDVSNDYNQTAFVYKI